MIERSEPNALTELGSKSLLADADCDIGELLERRDAALRNFMRLDELLYFAMKRKILETNKEIDHGKGASG
jgi:sensor domain CHASE-containing protein